MSAVATAVATGSSRVDRSRLADRAGLAILIGVGLVLGVGFAQTGYKPVDTDLYWQTARSTSYYGGVWGQGDAFFVYPPPLAQLVGLLEPIGWEAFVVGWTVFTFVGLWAMTRALAIPTLVVGGIAAVALGVGSLLAEPLVLATIGNIGIWLLAAIVAGFRWPAAWAIVVLTKIAPGVGLLWFVFRKEWRNLAIALGAIGSVAAVSFVAAPEQWAAFIRFAVDNASTPSPNPVVPIPWVVRLLMSVILIAWGARTDRPWIVPFAAGWSSIALYHQAWVSMALASLAMYVWMRASGTSTSRVAVKSSAARAITEGTAS